MNTALSLGSKPLEMSPVARSEKRGLYLHATLKWSRHRILPTDSKVRTTCLDGLFYLGDRSVVFRSWTQHLDLHSVLLQLTVGVEGLNSYTVLLMYCNVLT